MREKSGGKSWDKLCFQLYPNSCLCERSIHEVVFGNECLKKKTHAKQAFNSGARTLEVQSFTHAIASRALFIFSKAC